MTSRKSGAARRSLLQSLGEAKLEFCWLCGLKCADILQIAHLDQNNTNDSPSNLTCLCPTCHRLFDVDFIPKSWVLDAKVSVESGSRHFDVSALWKAVEDLKTNGKKANWSKLTGVTKADYRRIAQKAHIKRKQNNKKIA